MIKCRKTNCNKPAAIISVFATSGAKYCIDHMIELKKQRKLHFAKFTETKDVFDYLCELRRLDLTYHLDDNPKDCFDDLPKAIMNKLLANHEALWQFASANNVDPHEYYPHFPIMPTNRVSECIDKALEKGYDVYREVAKQMFDTIDPTRAQCKIASAAIFRNLYGAKP